MNKSIIDALLKKIENTNYFTPTEKEILKYFILNSKDSQNINIQINSDVLYGEIKRNVVLLKLKKPISFGIGDSLEFEVISENNIVILSNFFAEDLYINKGYCKTKITNLHADIDLPKDYVVAILLISN